MPGDIPVEMGRSRAPILEGFAGCICAGEIDGVAENFAM